MRLPYVPDPPAVSSEKEQAIVDRVRIRRGERGLTLLDRALLHSPPVTDGWNSFLGAIRTGTSLSPSLRESAICRVAVLNRAWYEWEHHAPILIEAGKMPEAATTAIFSTPPGLWRTTAEHRTTTGTPHDDGSAGSKGLGLPDDHVLVLEFTDALTLDVHVPDEIVARMKETFSEREIVEITTTIGAYNCVSRFLVALDVGESNGVDGMEAAIKLTGGVREGAELAPRLHATI